MESVLSFVVGLLTAALSLLGFVQQHPELPQASRDQAQQIVQQSITQATQTLQSQNTVTAAKPAPSPNSNCPSFPAPKCNSDQTYSEQKDLAGCGVARECIGKIETQVPAIELTAIPSHVSPGQSSTVTWVSKYANKCTGYENGSLAQNNPENVTLSGSFTQSFSKSKTYTYTCGGPGGYTTKSVTITVNNGGVSASFPTQLGNYTISTELRKPESVSKCDVVGSGETCYSIQTAEYREADSNRGVYVTAQKFTKGRDVTEQYLSTHASPVQINGKNMLRVENHELAWWTASATPFDLIFTQEFTANKDSNGNLMYSYGTATGDNPVIKYLADQYLPR